MKNLRRILILVLTLVLLTTMVTPVFASGSNYSDIGEITQALANLEPYVHYVVEVDIHSQTFDAVSALEDGFAEEIVLLAEEMVAYQNALTRAMAVSDIEDVTQIPLSKKQYPRLNKFLEAASKQLKSKDGFSPTGSIDSAIPCGDWCHPVPNYTPSWVSFSSSDPHNALHVLGFHHTAEYACGYGNCSTHDFTRGRSYTGPYGTCSSPRFRDHGRIWTSTTFGIQYGEPNPEILSYSWPYWNWGSYVQWWHNTY